MPNPRRLIPVGAIAGLTAVLFTLSACDDSGVPLEPGLPGGETQFSRQITLDELETSLIEGPVRLEIELVPGGLVAREVEIEQPEELADDEEIESRITAIDDATGTLTLALGDLQVTYDAATRFRAESDGGDLTRAEFVSRVEAALAAGAQPPVEAERDPPTEPQAPDDPTFHARELRLDDEADEPEIEINVDADNLMLNDAPPPDAWIRVLGLQIEVRASEGITELEAELPDLEGQVDFEGMAQSADPAARTVTLMNGTVIRIVAGTEIEEADDDDELPSLAAVRSALDAGLFVEVDGKGIVETTEPRVIVAIEIEFEVEDELEDVPGAGAFEFQASVTAADVAARTFTLGSGAVVRLTDETTIDPEGDLLTLQAVADAVAADRPVRADGDAQVESMGPPLTLVADVVKFEVDD